MPLTLTLTKGVLPIGLENIAFARLTDSMMRWLGIANDPFLTPNFIGCIKMIDHEQTFSGSNETVVVFIEWKLPTFAFITPSIQIGYIKEATDIILELTGGQHPKDRIWVNVIHVVDGAWGIAGNAMTNVELEASVTTN